MLTSLSALTGPFVEARSSGKFWSKISQISSTNFFSAKFFCPGNFLYAFLDFLFAKNALKKAGRRRGGGGADLSIVRGGASELKGVGPHTPTPPPKAPM